MLGNVALAKVAIDLGEDVRGHLDDIAKVAEEAATISRQLLGFSRMQMARPEVIEAHGGASAARARMRRLERIGLRFLWRGFLTHMPWYSPHRIHVPPVFAELSQRYSAAALSVD